MYNCRHPSGGSRALQGLAGMVALLLAGAAHAQQHAHTAATEPGSADRAPPTQAASDALGNRPPALERAALIREVLASNPSLEAARATITAARARVAPARAFDDTRVSYSLAPLSIASERVRFGQQVSVEQPLPWPGRRALRAEVAQVDEAVARRDLEDLQLQLALASSQLYDDYFLVHRAIAINGEHIALLRALKESAEAQYVVGRASQQDPLQAEVELSHLLHEQLTLRTQLSTLQAQLNALLHRPPQAPLAPPPESLAVPDTPPPDSVVLQAEALRERPELEALRARVGGSEAAVKLARLGYYPDFHVMGSYNSMWMTREHQFMAGLSVNIPVFQLSARRAEMEAARAERLNLKSAELQLIDSIRAEVHEARERLMEARHVIDLYGGRVLPAARDQVAAARAGFTSGRNGFQSVVEAQRNLRTAQLRLEEAIAGVQSRQAELSRAVGLLPGLLGEELRQQVPSATSEERPQ